MVPLLNQMFSSCNHTGHLRAWPQVILPTQPGAGTFQERIVRLLIGGGCASLSVSRGTPTLPPTHRGRSATNLNSWPTLSTGTEMQRINDSTSSQTKVAILVNDETSDHFNTNFLNSFIGLILYLYMCTKLSYRQYCKIICLFVKGYSKFTAFEISLHDVLLLLSQIFSAHIALVQQI